MKVKSISFNSLSMAVISSFIFTSCVNQITDESINESSKTPIVLSTDIYYVKSRVLDNKFQDKDAIGLYVLSQPNTLDEERFIDNALLIYSQKDDFLPKDTLYYPKHEVLSDFISYYPYQNEGFLSNQTKIKVEVKENQSTLEQHTLSDFMLASTKSIKATNHPVNLTFKHKMSKLHIRIKAKDKDKKLKEVLFDFPSITCNGFYTVATYDFKNDSFSEFSKLGYIIPFGEWTLANNQLMGKEVLLFPQQVNAEQQSITLNVDNEMYSCPFPENLDLKAGESNELTINFTPSKGIEIESIHPLIAEWNTGDSIETENDMMHKQINLSDLDFQKSKVALILSEKREPLYEVTKELLISGTFREQAIIAYPIVNKKADLTQGIVLDLVGNHKNIHGGTIRWNKLDNSFEYKEGIQSPLKSFFINKQNEIKFNLPEDSQWVYLCDKVLSDKRRDEQNTYPIVKIGTQYWMGSELHTSYYNNGEKIKQVYDKTVKDTPSIIQTKKYPNYYFYNEKAILTNQLAPKGWRIPSTSDWNRLNEYIQQDMALLLNKSWNKKNAYNLSGFNSKPIGTFSGSKYETLNTGYWTLKDINSKVPAEKFITILTSKKSLSYIDNKYQDALAIRCIMKE